MSRNLRYKAETRALNRELDDLEKDLTKEIHDVTQATYKELLPRLLGGDSAGAASAYQRAWADAVEKVLIPNTPRAYIRTGGLADPNTVKLALFSQQTFQVFEALPGNQAGFSFTLTIILDPQYSLETHQENQESLEKIDPDKHLRREIKYPVQDAGNPNFFHYVYPAISKPHINPEVVGSFWKQNKPYLIQYLLAGPNKPGAGSAAVYRHLGHEGNLSAPRNSDRGGEILDEFMDILGAEHITLGDSLVATTTQTTRGVKGKVVNETIKLLSQALNGVMSVNINFEAE